MTRTFLLAGVLLVTVMAGCIGNDEGTGDTPPFVDPCPSSPLDADEIRLMDTTEDPIEGLSRENAWLFETTNKRTCSLPAIGWEPLHPDGVPHWYIGEIDMRGDLNLGAVAVLGNNEAPRVYIVDITNRSDPEVISWIDQDNTYIVDVKFSDDGRYLFTASQSLPTSPEFEGLDQLSGPTGFSIYDLADPTAPTFVTTHVDPQIGCHMLSHEIIAGTDALFCISQNVRVYGFERTPAGPTNFGFVDYFPEGDDGNPQPSAPPTFGLIPGQVAGALSSGPHDMTVTEDPVDGRTYAVVSHWNAGVRVVDVTDLPVMTEVGKWTGEGATHYDGNVHTAMMFYVGEDRYIMASPEMTYGGIVPSLWLLDANDLSDLKLVGEWFTPAEHTTDGLFLTTHQWQVAPTGADVNASDVRVYLTMNHGGVWVLDLGEILAGDREAAILGYNLARFPLDEDTNPVGNAVLATWDVNVVDGHIYGSDRSTGLWVFHYQNDTLGDARLTGFA